MTAEIITREQIARVTIQYLAAELGISTSDIGDADLLRELPTVDSMRMLRVVSKLEREFDVEFDDEAIFAATTVDELVALVEKSLAAS
jgi:acyl carrier protein